MSSIRHGFTLIELLVVLSIISVLATVIVASLNSSREKSKINQTAVQIQELHKAADFYRIDTGEVVPNTCGLSCTESTDPLQTNVNSIPGWYGPYFPVSLVDFTHQWGGHMTVRSGNVDTSDPDIEMYVFLDDDAPGTSSSDNSGIIPNEAIQEIDSMLDDGDLETGNLRGMGQFFTAPVGEFVFIIE